MDDDGMMAITTCTVVDWHQKSNTSSIGLTSIVQRMIFGVFTVAIATFVLSRDVNGLSCGRVPMLRKPYSKLLTLQLSSENEESEEPQTLVNGETSSNSIDDEQDSLSQAIDSVKDSVVDYTFLVNQNSKTWKKRVLSYRSYAREDVFRDSEKRPGLKDLMMNAPSSDDSFFLSIPGTGIISVIAIVTFPFIAGNLALFVDMPPEQLDSITSKFVPGVTVIYGTFVSLTLSILYRRQQAIQDSVAQETSLLSFILQNFLFLFNKNRERMVEAAQLTADQVQVLLRESRGGEYLTMIYGDPYTKMLSIVSAEEERLSNTNGGFERKGVSSKCSNSLNLNLVSILVSLFCLFCIACAWSLSRHVEGLETNSSQQAQF